MADLKISALNSLAGADLVAADVVAVVDDSASETKKLTVSDLIANGVTLISDSTIPSAKILFSAGSVDTAELAASAVETAKINDSAVTAAKLADNSSVTLVSTLPASGDFTGQIALDTDDDKIYIWDGSAWDSVKGAGSINVVNGSTSGIVNITTSTSGDTVTVSTTLDDTSAAAQFLAGPTGAGGTVGYRAIIGTDLPTATTSAKGGVIVNGNGLVMSGETLTIDNSVTAETSENHLVQYDANGLITSGRAIVAGDVPVATSSATGAVKPGSGLEVTAAGAINHSNSVSGATAAKVTFDAQGHITASEALAASDIPDLDASKITTGTLPTARLANDAVTADKLGDKSTTTIAETTPAGGSFIGQGHLNSISGDFLIWDGNVWQPIGISVGEIVLAGTYDASTNLMATVTSEGTALSFVVGSALPAASSSNKGYYVVVSEAGTGTSPAPAVALNPPDFLLSTGTAYTEIDVSSTVTAQVATNVGFTAAGNIAATNVQAAIEELDTEKVGAASPTFTGTVGIGTGATIQFEGASANDFETTLTVTDPTADRTITLPNVTGTVVTTGDTGSVTSTMILDGTIANADISSSAEIAVSKLANGTARQLLQTDSAGTGVEFTSNVDIPGTLDVTGAATLDSTLGVTGLISADGKVKFPAGSASAPSFYSGTDTNTGLYFSAADEISVATGGTQRVVVDSSGRVLVGASSAASVASNQFKFNVSGESFADSGTVQVRYGASSGPTAIFANARGTTASPSTLQDSDELGKIRFYGHDGTDFANYAAAIQAEVDGTPGSNDMPGRLVFSTTADGASTPTERLRIDSSGNVGIGTSSPDTPLTVGGTNAAIRVQPSNAASASIFLRHGSVSNNCGLQANQNGELILIADGTDRVKIDASGRLLVGTSSSRSNGYGDNAFLQLEGTTYPKAAISAILNSNNANGPSINFAKTRGTSAGSSTVVQSGDTLGVINFAGGDGTDIESPAAKIVVEVDGTPGSNDMPGRIIFQTTSDGSASPSERMRIDSSGRLLVGTTTEGEASADDLTVANSGDCGLTIRSGTSSKGKIFFSDGTSGLDESRGYIQYQHSNDALRFGTDAVERLRIDSSGRLLVGTPSAETFRANITPILQLEGTSANTGSASLFVNSNDSSGPFLVLGKSRATGANGDTAVQDDDGCGAIQWVAADGTDRASRVANISAFIDGTPGSNDTPGRLVFSTTADGASTSTERMRIDSSGRVGIGTASPSSFNSNANQLVISGSGNTGLTIDATSSTSSSIHFADGSSGNESYRGIVEYDHSNDSMLLYTSATERMRIDSSGRLLLGTTSAPSAGNGQYGRLVVQGYIGDSAAGAYVNLQRGQLATAPLASDIEIARINFSDSAGNDFGNIGCYTDAATGSGDYPGRLVFSTTADGASSTTERLIINNKGVVTVKNGAVAEIDTLTSASTVTPDFATSCNFTLTLGTNVTLANPSNLTAGQSGSIFLVQDGTGSRSITFGSYWDFAGGSAPTISTAASSVDRLDYIVRTSTSIHAVVTLAYS
jgi:hypothetical protein